MRKQLSQRFLLLLAGILVSFSALAQTITVKGHVQDTQGVPVVFATVASTTTKASTNTDDNGNFTLQTQKGATLRVSYIGYKTVTVKAEENLKIVLEENNDLTEALVVGYAKVKKSDATGSVTALKPDALTKGLTTSAQDMLVGKVAGVNVASEGGQPGAGAKIRIRGGSSLNASNDPLIVIDGLAMDNEGVQGLSNALAMVNPEDIASYTVLKDASATAIYGSRASNGVIIITTKKGSKQSAPRVTYNGHVSFGTTRKTYDLLNGDEYRAFARKAYLAANPADPTAALMPTLGTDNTDWQKQIYRTALGTDHNLSISGGFGNFPYRVSLGYTNDNGIVKTSSFERFTAALNLSPSFFEEHLQINLTAKYMNAKNRYAEGGVFGAATGIDPTRPVYSSNPDNVNFTGGYYQKMDPTSAYNNPGWTATTNTNTPQNPVALLNLKNDRSNANTFIGNVEADYKLHFFPDIHIHANLGGDYSEGLQNTTISPYSFSNNYYGWDGYAKSYKYNLQGNIYAQYIHTFDQHMIDVMAGAEEQHFHRRIFSEGSGSDWYDATGTKLDKPNPYNPAFRKETMHIYRNSLVSYFGRLNYSLLDRYLLTFTMRWDGSSRFAKKHRWGTFPSLALGWKLKQEDFLKDVSWLDELKLRLGWGITGQQNIGYDFYYLPRYVQGNSYAQYPFGDEYFTIYRPEAYNPDLKWERTTTWNAGVDFSLLNGRLSAAVDYYYRQTNDLISTVQVPAGTNFSNYVTKNIGSLRNTGLEFSIDARPVVTNDFTWQVTYNATWNSNKITKLTGDNTIIKAGNSISRGLGNKVQANIVGRPANSFYVYQQVYDNNGRPLEGVFVDRNGDGIINEDDKYVYKKPTADVTMGMTNKFLYKNWDFSFTMRASLNNYLYYDFLSNKANVTWAGIYSNGAYSNVTKEAVDLGFTGKTDYYMSDYFVRNASFLRFDNITLGYTFRDLFKAGKYGGISGRVYATVQNPFVITKYKGLDPEIDSGNGVDNNFYPRPTTYMLGVSLQF